MSRPSVPFVDVPAMMAAYGDRLESAVVDVIRSGQFINGPQVTQLEERLAARTGVPHAIACSSGTVAQQLLLMALGVGPGDEVLVPDFTFIATAEAVATVGATPVFVDVDRSTFTLDPQAVREAMGPKVKAVVAVSLFGQCAAMEELEALCDEFGVWFLEDAAQSLGARLGDRESGSFGKASFTSFYPSKPLGGIGDGGMVFTSDPRLARRLKLVREHGQTGRHFHETMGMNGRLDTLQAAALLVKVDRFDEEVEMRRAAARRYDEALGDWMHTPVMAPGRYSSYAQYTLRMQDSTDRESLVEHLASCGVPTAVHYPRPVHTQPSLQPYIDRSVPTPVTAWLCERVVSLPLSAYISHEDQDRVIAAVLAWAQSGRAAAAGSH